MKSYKYDPRKFCYKPISWWQSNKKVALAVTVTAILFSFWVALISFNPPVKIVEKRVVNTIIIPDSSYSIEPTTHDQLIEALIFVESSGRDSVVNSTSGATGCLQILPIMVREVNRILKLSGNTKTYTLSDRYNRVKSIEMFHIWRIYHHSNHSYEVIARNWNGGTNGYLMPATLPYWNKVKAILNKSKK